MSLPIQRLCTIFALAFFFGSPAHAIVNVLPVPGKEISGLSGSATLKGSIKTGNTDIIDVGLSGATIYGSELFQTSLRASANYGEKSNEKYLYNTFEHLRIRYKLSGVITPEAFIQHQFNEFRAIKFRGLVGLGAAFTLWEEDAGHAVLGTTYMLEREVANGEPINLNSKDLVSRWSNYLQLGFKTESNVHFSSTLFVQPLLSDFGDLRIYNESGFSVKVHENAAIGTSFKLTYDSKPLNADVEKLDTATVAQLTLKF